MLYSIAHSFSLLILFTSLPIFLQSVSAQNEVTCISNYAEMKQALLQEGTGNMERLLYAFTPPNRPLPHYIWVYYYHNQSSEWSDILSCPSSSSIPSCPESSRIMVSNGTSNYSSSKGDSIYHVIFWGDSPMLINLDIPLLKLLSYNSILQYLQPGPCVQLVIPPFCETMDQASETEILNFVTSYLRSYSTSNQESERDYVLNCDEKFETEFSYSAYLFGSEVIICVGSGLLFVFLSLKLSSKRENKKVVKKGNNSDGKQEETAQGTSMSRNNSEENQTNMKRSIKFFIQSFEKGNCIERHKKYLSVVLIINIITILFLITDSIQFSLNADIVQDAFLYAYGGLNIILFAVAWLSVFIKIIFTYYMISFCTANKCFLTDAFTQRNQLFLYLTLVLSTVLTLASFLYILSRAFLIALAFATYPFEVGFILLAIGSGVAALLFVIWAIVHITVDSFKARVKWFTVVISLVPYGALLIILTGFLLSYIYVILRVNIRLADPVTSLASALVPGAIAFVAATRYESELKVINNRNGNDEEMQTGQEKPSTKQPESTQLPVAIMQFQEKARPPASPPATPPAAPPASPPANPPAAPPAAHTNEIAMSSISGSEQLKLEEVVESET